MNKTLHCLALLSALTSACTLASSSGRDVPGGDEPASFSLELSPLTRCTEEAAGEVVPMTIDGVEPTGIFADEYAVRLVSESGVRTELIVDDGVGPRLPASLLPGAYTVEVVRKRDDVTVSSAPLVSVMRAATITAIANNGGLCRDDGTTSTFIITGTGLSNARVALDTGFQNDVRDDEVLVGAGTATQMTVTLPSTVANGSYTVVIDDENGCRVRSAVPLVLSPAPVVSSVSYGPRRGSGALQSNLRNTVRVVGLGLVAPAVDATGAGALISVQHGGAAVNAQAFATPDTAPGTSIEAIFEPGTLPVGTARRLVVNQFGCAPSNQPMVNVEEAPAVMLAAFADPAKPLRFSPSIVPLQFGALLDVFAAAPIGNNFRLAMDVNPDPINENWFHAEGPNPSAVMTLLDSTSATTAKALRLALAADATSGIELSPGRTVPLLLRIRTSDGELLLQPPAPATGEPQHTVDTALRASGNITLATAARIVHKTSGTVSSGLSGDAVRQGGLLRVFGCNLTGTDLSFVAVDSAGAELPLTRLTDAANQKDDDAWTAGNFRCARVMGNAADSFTTLQIDLPPGIYRLRLKQQFNAAIPPALHDDLYPFVVYGASPTLQGPAGAASFAVDPALALHVPRRNASGFVGTDALGRKFAYVAAGDATNSVNPVDLGGGSTARNSYEVSPVAPDNSLLGFTPSLRPDETHAIELQGPISNYGTYGAAFVADGPNVYLIGGTNDGTVNSGTNHGYVLTARVNDPTNYPDEIPGTLSQFIRTDAYVCGVDCISERMTFGASAELVYSLATNTRSIIVTGGATPDNATVNRDATNQVTRVLLSDVGNAVSSETVSSGAITLPSPQAFAMSFQTPTHIVTFGGISGVDNAELNPLSVASQFRVASQLTSGFTSMPFQATPTWNYWGSSHHVAGDSVWISGGAFMQDLAGGNLGSVFAHSLRATLSSGDLGMATTVPQLLSRKRGMAASVHLAPNAYTLGGIICNLPSDACTVSSLAVTDSTEHGVFLP